jgi:GMP synthase PP-ATPase subunit
LEIGDDAVCKVHHERVRGINQVINDITSEPPGTIEWE